MKFCINTGEPIEKLIEKHPRLQTLIDLYGVPQQDKKEAQTLAEEIISVTLSCIRNGGSLNKKIPVSMTISNLKILCNRLFKMEVNEMKVFYRQSKDIPCPEELDDDTRPLSYYDVKDNSELIIEESLNKKN